MGVQFSGRNVACMADDRSNDGSGKELQGLLVQDAAMELKVLVMFGLIGYGRKDY